MLFWLIMESLTLRNYLIIMERLWMELGSPFIKGHEWWIRGLPKVKEKGYKVFVQAMVSVAYTDEEFLELISRVNEIEPYAFYIVDSFGMMKRKDLTRLFYIVEHNLKPCIWIGFHSHNNLQLAYSNAQSLVDMQTNRKLIVDSSVYGWDVVQAISIQNCLCSILTKMPMVSTS